MPPLPLVVGQCSGRRIGHGVRRLMTNGNPCPLRASKVLPWRPYKKSWCPLPWSPTHDWPRCWGWRGKLTGTGRALGPELLLISGSSPFGAWASICQLPQCLGLKLTIWASNKQMLLHCFFSNLVQIPPVPKSKPEPHKRILGNVPLT